MWYLPQNVDSYKGVRTHRASCRKKEKVFITRFDDTVVEDVSHSNDEIETNAILNSCEIPAERKDNVIHEGNNYLPNLPAYKEVQSLTPAIIINNIQGDKFEHLINVAYNETIFWRKKIIYASLRENSKTI